MDFKKQKKMVNIILACAYFVCFARFIPIRNQIGDEGVGLFAAAFLLYFIYMSMVRAVFSELISKMINSRMKRDQYKNAGRVFDFSLLAGAASGIVVCIVVFLLSGVLAGTVLGMEHTIYVIRYMAPAYTFGTVIAVFSGYLKGVGDYVTDALLALGSELLTSLLCLLMSGVTYGHGTKVSDLLHQEVYAGVYGAQGCGIAVSLSAFLMLLLYLLFYAQTKVAFKRRTMKDAAAREEEYSLYAHMLYISSAVTYVSVFLTVLCLYVEERILVSHMNAVSKEHPEQLLNAAATWGRYFGKGIVFVWFPIAVIYVIYHGTAVYLRRSLNQDDRKNIRDTMQMRLRKYMLVFLPLTVFLFVFTKPLMGFVSIGQISDVMGAVKLGTLSVFFIGLAYIFAQICIAMDKKLYILIIQAVCFLLHIIVMRIGIRSYENAASAIGLAQLVCAVVTAVMYGALFTLQLGYRHNLLHLIKPLIGSVISGLLGMLIVMLFAGKVADVLTLIIGSIVFVILYLILMALLHGLSKKELLKLPGGAFLVQMFYHR